MKAFFWFAVAVFVISAARPVWACGSNSGRNAPTTTAGSSAPASGQPGAAGAGRAGTPR